MTIWGFFLHRATSLLLILSLLLGNTAAINVKAAGNSLDYLQVPFESTSIPNHNGLDESLPPDEEASMRNELPEQLPVTAEEEEQSLSEQDYAAEPDETSKLFDYSDEHNTIRSIGLRAAPPFSKNGNKLVIEPILGDYAGGSTTHSVLAHGVASEEGTVTYTLNPGASFPPIKLVEEDGDLELKFPNSSQYSPAVSEARLKHEFKSNWQGTIGASFSPNTVYTITANTPDGTYISERFLIYEVKQHDLVQRIANHYGVDCNDILADNELPDELTVEGTRLYIREPGTDDPYNADQLTDEQRERIEYLLLGRNPYSCYDLEPVNLNTGNFYLEAKDAVLPDIGGDFAIRRTYNSMSSLYPGLFGKAWASELTENLTLLGDGSILYISSDGKVIPFGASGGHTTATGFDYTLSRSGTDWILTDEEGAYHHFNRYGLLTALEDIHGNRTTLSYDGAYHLTQVTTPSGKTFSFTVDNKDRATSITLPDGGVLYYE